MRHLSDWMEKKKNVLLSPTSLNHIFGRGPLSSEQRGLRLRFLESHGLESVNMMEGSDVILVSCLFPGITHSHQVSGTDCVLKVHEVTVREAVTVGLGNVLHLPQESRQLACAKNFSMIGVINCMGKSQILR